jgi:hypothetical protein
VKTAQEYMAFAEARIEQVQGMNALSPLVATLLAEAQVWATLANAAAQLSLRDTPQVTHEAPSVRDVADEFIEEYQRR